MEEIKKYQDSFGIIHHLPVNRFGVSENGPLFTADYALISAILNPFARRAWLGQINAINQDGRFYADPATKGDHFSHDNMTGLYILSYLQFMTCSHLPVFKWNGRWWLHPRDVLFYGAMKGNMVALLLGFLFLPFFMAHSLLRDPVETSGKRLWFLRISALSTHIGFLPALLGAGLHKLSILIRSAMKTPYTWGDVYRYYYTCNGKAVHNWDHPTLIKIGELMGEET